MPKCVVPTRRCHSVVLAKLTCSFPELGGKLRIEGLGACGSPRAEPPNPKAGIQGRDAPSVSPVQGPSIPEPPLAPAAQKTGVARAAPS